MHHDVIDANGDNPASLSSSTLNDLAEGVHQLAPAAMQLEGVSSELESLVARARRGEPLQLVRAAALVGRVQALVDVLNLGTSTLRLSLDLPEATDKAA